MVANPTFSSKDTFRLYFEESADGLLLMDDKVFIDCNRAALKLLGYDCKEDIIGKQPALISPEFQPDGRRSTEKAQDLVDTVIREGHLRFEWVHTRMNNEPFYAEILLTALHKHGNTLLLSVMRDITERKEAEIALRHMNQTLEERVAQRTRELIRRSEVAEAMRELLTVLNSNRTLDEILLFSAEQAVDLLGIDAIVLYQEDEETLLINPILGWDEIVASIRELPMSSVAGQQYQYILTENRNIYVQNVENSQLLESFGEYDDDETSEIRRHLRNAFHGSLAIPLTFSSHVRGVLSFYYREERSLSTDDLALAQSFAEQVALAIENARLRDRAEQAGAAAERGRLAHDLHDSVTQTLFSASLIAEVLPKLWTRDQDIASEQLQELRRLTRGAMAEMRTLLLELRPETLSKAPLSETLRHLVDSTIGRASIPVGLTIDNDLNLSSEIKVALYRIAQEALNNVAKHADANHAEIRITSYEHILTMEIIDDGTGFQFDEVQATCLGLNIMKERADTIGAELKIKTEKHRGTSIRVSLGYQEE